MNRLPSPPSSDSPREDALPSPRTRKEGEAWGEHDLCIGPANAARDILMQSGDIQKKLDFIQNGGDIFPENSAAEKAEVVRVWCQNEASVRETITRWLEGAPSISPDLLIEEFDVLRTFIEEARGLVGEEEIAAALGLVDRVHADWIRKISE